MTFSEVRIGDLLNRSGLLITVEVDGRYRTAGIRSFGVGIFERSEISGLETKYKSLWRISPDQLVFSKLFAWEGAVAVAGKAHDGLMFSGEFPIFDIDESRLLPAFAGYLVQWPGLHERLRGSTTGVGNRRQRVNPDRFLNVEIPLPPVDAQRRIAAKLDRFFVSLPSAVERSWYGLSGFGNALLAGAFHDDLPMVHVVDILELERIPISVDPSGTYRQIGIRSFGNGIFHRPPVLGAELAKLKYFEILPNRIIFSNIMAWEGAIAVSGQGEEGFVGSQRFLSYRPRVGASLVDLDYLNYFFRTERGMSQVREGSADSVKRNQTLSPGAIDRFEVPLPSLAEQRRVVALLNLNFNRLRSVMERRGQVVNALRAAMLNAAFSGQL